jgi:hypothetical protein
MRTLISLMYGRFSRLLCKQRSQSHPLGPTGPAETLKTQPIQRTRHPYPPQTAVIPSHPHFTLPTPSFLPPFNSAAAAVIHQFAMQSHAPLISLVLLALVCTGVSSVAAEGAWVSKSSSSTQGATRPDRSCSVTGRFVPSCTNIDCHAA